MNSRHFKRSESEKFFCYLDFFCIFVVVFKQHLDIKNANQEYSNNMEKVFKKKTSGWMVFNLIWRVIIMSFFLGLLFLMTELVYGYSLDLLVPILIVVSLLLFYLDATLWHIGGQEIVRMDNEKLVIKKRWKIFNRQKSINLFDIDEIFFETYPLKIFSLSWFFLERFEVRGGKICVEYKGQHVVYIGQNLSDEEAKKCIEEMNAKLSEFNRQHLHSRDIQKRKIKKILGFPIVSLENILTLIMYLSIFYILYILTMVIFFIH